MNEVNTISDSSLINNLGAPHFSPPNVDYSFIVPFSYAMNDLKLPPVLAVIVHVFYIDLVEEIVGYLKNIPYSYDLFISTDTEEKKLHLENTFNSWRKGKVRIILVPNRGRDIAPKILTWPDVYIQYEYILYIHTKKTMFNPVLKDWRHYLFETLLGSEEIVRSVFEAFYTDSKLGIIAPQHFPGIRHLIGWGHNFPAAEKFAKKMGIELSINDQVDFPSGSMFWARSHALLPILNYGILLDDFPGESEQKDHTLAHVIERLFFFSCEKAGLKWIKIINPKVDSSLFRYFIVRNKKELQKLINFSSRKLIPLNYKNDSMVLKRIFRNIYSKFRNNRHIKKLGFIALNQFSNPRLSKSYFRYIQEKSPYNDLNPDEFIMQMKRSAKGNGSIIDFNEEFYLNVNYDVKQEVIDGSFYSGFSHFCLHGQNERRLWSNNKLECKFSLVPNLPKGMFAPVNLRLKDLNNPNPQSLSKDHPPYLLILFPNLQQNLFYAGYTEFFHDFLPVFDHFPKIVLAVEHHHFEPELAHKFLSRIEVISQKQLNSDPEMPDVIICYSAHMVTKAVDMFNDLNKIVYYCQEFESGFFPFGSSYIEAERAIYHSRHLVISTALLKNFLQQRDLITTNHILVTSPKLERFQIRKDKEKKLFFYFRPEYFNTRNLHEILWDVMQKFCQKYTGYELFLAGTIDTCFSFQINNNDIFVISKLPKDKYFQLISQCDVVVAMIYSAHPGVIAFQAAASGLPVVTNIFDNRNAELLCSISENIVPFDPVRDQLLEKIEIALAMPKGRLSFNENLYSGNQDYPSFEEFISVILEQKHLQTS